MAVFKSHMGIDNPFDQAKYTIARNVNYASIVVFTTVSLLMTKESPPILIFYWMSAAMAALGSIYLLFSRNYKVVYLGMTLGASVVIQYVANFSDHYLHYAGFLWLGFASVYAFLGLGKKIGLIILGLNLVGVVYFFLNFFDDNLLYLQHEISNYHIVSVVEVTSVIVMLSYMIFHFINFHEKALVSLEKANDDLEKQNDLIRTQNEEKTVLVKEIHHRIKNNLQIIISLLRMQREEAVSEESQENFTEAINRIMTMSLIHQKLYKEEELSKIDLKSYIEQLVEDLISVSLFRDKVELQVETNISHMGLDMVVPLGLLINELVSNTLKYAFIESGGGEIKIRLNQSGPSYGFAYFDNGIWKEPEERSSGFGTELIDILTEQLNGTKKLTINNGTSYNFTLKEPTYV